MRLNYTRFHGDTRLVVPNGFLCLVKKELKIIRHKILSRV